MKKGTVILRMPLAIIALPIVLCAMSAFAQNTAKEQPASPQPKQQDEPQQGQSRNAKLLDLSKEKASTQAAGQTYSQSKRLSAPGRINAPRPNEKEDTFIGVTIWRLPQSSSGDTSPVRVEADTPLSVGDRVFLTIESPREGYLYVINREMYANGRFGDPDLIFPTKRILKGNNKIEPNILAKIPDRESEPPYFDITSRFPDHVGESITIIVKSTPIAGLQIGRESQVLSKESFAKWEKDWGVRAKELNLNGGGNQRMTDAEKQNIAERGRGLKHSDPFPQIIYPLVIKRGDPLFVTVFLELKK